MAEFASRMNSLYGSGNYRINVLARAAKEWRKTALSKYASASDPSKCFGFDGKAVIDMRIREERLHCRKMSLIGWSDAAHGGRSPGGEFRLGYAISLMSSSLTGPRRISHRSSKFIRKLVKSSLGGEVSALSEMVDHMPFAGL